MQTNARSASSLVIGKATIDAPLKERSCSPTVTAVLTTDPPPLPPPPPPPPLLAPETDVTLLERQERLTETATAFNDIHKVYTLIAIALLLISLNLMTQST